jgi:hypothetical protein
MPTAAEGLVDGDSPVSPPLEEVLAERFHDPEWHRLRLFGRGRHWGAFDAGAETHNEL